MPFTFGAETAQYDGQANDGDPNNGGPRQYNGTTPATVNDFSAVAMSDAMNGSYGGHQFLAAEAKAIAGPNANQLAACHSFNKTAMPITRQLSFIQRLLERFGIRRTSLRIDLLMHATIATGPGTVRHAVWLRTQSGIWIVQHQHNYEFSLDPATGEVVVVRDGQPWKVMTNGDTAADAFHYKHLRMPQGQYLFQSELNVTASADGRVVMSGNLNAVLTE